MDTKAYSPTTFDQNFDASRALCSIQGPQKTACACKFVFPGPNSAHQAAPHEPFLQPYSRASQTKNFLIFRLNHRTFSGVGICPSFRIVKSILAMTSDGRLPFTGHSGTSLLATCSRRSTAS